jgi:Zn-dependent protease with chaperone function
MNMHVWTLILVAALPAAAVLWPLAAYLGRRGAEEAADVVVGAALVASVVLVAAALVSGVAAADSRSCEQRADDLGRDHRYGLLADCRVETDDGRFVPLDNLRVTDEERTR